MENIKLNEKYCTIVRYVNGNKISLVNGNKLTEVFSEIRDNLGFLVRSRG